MFMNDESFVWTFFTVVCFNGDPFATRIKETRSGETKTAGTDDGHTVPYRGRAN